MEQKLIDIDSRKQYTEAWNDTMVKIWRERIIKLGVFETPRRKTRVSAPHLLDSLRLFPVQHDDKYMELTMHYTFPEYGIFQDLGVGREKAIGNPGDIGEFTQGGKDRKIRKPRKWFSIKWYASCMNLKEFMARAIGDEFIGIITGLSNPSDTK